MFLKFTFDGWLKTFTWCAIPILGITNEEKDRLDTTIEKGRLAWETRISQPLIATHIFRVKGYETLRQWCIIKLGWLTGEGTLKGRKIVPFATHSWLSRKVLLIHEDGFQLKTVSHLRLARTIRIWKIILQRLINLAKSFTFLIHPPSIFDILPRIKSLIEYFLQYETELNSCLFVCISWSILT